MSESQAAIKALIEISGNELRDGFVNAKQVERIGKKELRTRVGHGRE